MKLSLSAVPSITLAVVATLLTAGIVNASLFLILTPESGPSGTEVTGRTGGHGAFATSVVGPLQTYFVDQADADGVISPDDPALVDIGQLMIDRSGNGSIRFVVPNLAPGAYVVMVHCTPCASFSAGRVMLDVASFDVTLKAPDTAMVDRFPAALLLTAFGVMLVLGAITFAMSRRRTPA